MKTTGMVRQESRCEIRASPEATEVSFPYPLGMTMLLSPVGIASTHIVQTAMLCGASRKRKRRKPIAGNAKSFTKVIT